VLVEAQCVLREYNLLITVIWVIGHPSGPGSAERSSSVEDEVDRVWTTLRRAIRWVLDSEGERARHLSLRKVDAFFYGIDSQWDSKRWAFGAEARGFLTDITVEQPAIATLYPDLEAPLEEMRTSLQSIVSAIEDDELDEPASTLWEQEWAKFLEMVERAESGQPEIVRCTICGAPFVEVEHVKAHFSERHPCPPPEVRRLVSVADQIEAIDRAQQSFVAAYDEFMRTLAEESLSDESNAQPQPTLGRKPHPWKDIILEQARVRRATDSYATNRREEAGVLLEWALRVKLPRAGGTKPPARGTIVNWLAADWQ